jgi:hypothetical protein
MEFSLKSPALPDTVSHAPEHSCQVSHIIAHRSEKNHVFRAVHSRWISMSVLCSVYMDAHLQRESAKKCSRNATSIFRTTLYKFEYLGYLSLWCDNTTHGTSGIYIATEQSLSVSSGFCVWVAVFLKFSSGFCVWVQTTPDLQRHQYFSHQVCQK